MAIVRPVTKTLISVPNWGVPITDEVNRLTTLTGSNVPTAWTNLPLVNGWSISSPSAYRKVGDMVQIRGAIQSGTIAGNTILATLPVGFRPTYIHYFTQPYYYAGWQNGVLAVNSSGNLIISIVALAGAPEPLSLDGITFTTIV